MLVIEDVPREAQGLFECKTNSDETQMKLRVAPVNEFLKPLEDQTCREKEQVTFECQMLDEEGDAEWRIAGSAANRLIGEVVQSRRRPLLGPSPG